MASREFVSVTRLADVDWTALVHDAGENPAGRQLLELPREQQSEAARAALERQIPLINGRDTCGSDALTALLQGLLRKKLPFTLADLEHMVGLLAQIERQGWWSAAA